MNDRLVYAADAYDVRLERWARVSDFIHPNITTTFISTTPWRTAIRTLMTNIIGMKTGQTIHPANRITIGMSTNHVHAHRLTPDTPHARCDYPAQASEPLRVIPDMWRNSLAR